MPEFKKKHTPVENHAIAKEFYDTFWTDHLKKKDPYAHVYSMKNALYFIHEKKPALVFDLSGTTKDKRLDNVLGDIEGFFRSKGFHAKIEGTKEEGRSLYVHRTKEGLAELLDAFHGTDDNHKGNVLGYPKIAIQEFKKSTPSLNSVFVDYSIPKKFEDHPDILADMHDKIELLNKHYPDIYSTLYLQYKIKQDLRAHYRANP